MCIRDRYETLDPKEHVWMVSESYSIYLYLYGTLNGCDQLVAAQLLKLLQFSFYPQVAFFFTFYVEILRVSVNVNFVCFRIHCFRNIY